MSGAGLSGVAEAKRDRVSIEGMGVVEVTDDPGDLRTISGAILSLGREVNQRNNDRTREALEKLETKSRSEHNHRLILLEVGIIGVVIPVFVSQTSGGLLPLRVSAGCVLLSAMGLLAWDLFAPAIRRKASAALLDYMLAVSKADWNRSVIPLLQSFGRVDSAQEHVGRQEQLDREQAAASARVSSAYDRAHRFDAWLMGVSYGLLLLGLAVLLWSIFIIAPTVEAPASSHHPHHQGQYGSA